MTIDESYAVLGLQKGSTNQEISTAYKELIKLYHPDTYKGDKEFATQKTMQIVTAYRVLTLKERASSSKQNFTNNFTKKQAQDAKRQAQREEKLKKEKEQHAKRKQEKQAEKQQRKQERKEKQNQRAQNKQTKQTQSTTKTEKPKFPIASIDPEFIIVGVLVIVLIVLLIIFANL